MARYCRRRHFVIINGQYIGSIKAAEFGRFFIDIWLAEKTSQPKLRAQLLGKISVGKRTEGKQNDEK